MKPSAPSSAALALVSAAAIASSSTTSSCLVSAFVTPSTSTNQNQNLNTYASARTNANAPSKTSLAFGVGGDDLADLSPSARKKRAQKGDINPAYSMQQYLTSLLDLQEMDVPPPSSRRTDLGSTVLVSGFVDPASPTLGKDSDQAIFDLLNVDTHPDEPDRFGLNFDRIVAFVPDAAFAKKRLVSRSARYSGLLNKLAFEQPAITTGSSIVSMPTAQQLEGVTSWVARIEGADRMGQIQSIVELVQSSPSIANVAFLLTDASSMDMDAVLNVVQTMKDETGLTKKSFTVVAVGTTDDEVPEATYPYAVTDLLASDADVDAATSSASSMDYSTTIPQTTHYAGAAPTTAGSIPAEATYSREESFRLVATCLGLECARNRALAFTAVDNVNATSYKLVKGLREAGYGWDQEVQFMIDGGAKVCFTIVGIRCYVAYLRALNCFLFCIDSMATCNCTFIHLYPHNILTYPIIVFHPPSPTTIAELRPGRRGLQGPSPRGGAHDDVGGRKARGGHCRRHEAPEGRERGGSAPDGGQGRHQLGVHPGDVRGQHHGRGLGLESDYWHAVVSGMFAHCDAM